MGCAPYQRARARHYLRIAPALGFGELFGRRTGIIFDPVSQATLTFGNVFDPERAARLINQHALDPGLPGLTEVLRVSGESVFRVRANDGYAREIARTVERTFVET